MFRKVIHVGRVALRGKSKIGNKFSPKVVCLRSALEFEPFRGKFNPLEGLFISDQIRGVDFNEPVIAARRAGRGDGRRDDSGSEVEVEIEKREPLPRNPGTKQLGVKYTEQSPSQ